MLDKVIRIGRLFDLYGPLLTDKQRSLVELYYHQDLSLAEIAELEGVSRQAVYDTIKRAASYLEDMEDKLGLIKELESMDKRLREIVESLLEIENMVDDDIKSELTKVTLMVKQLRQ